MAVGLSGVMFALHLVALGLNVWWIGLSISAGLTGCAIGTVAVTYLTDRVGRRTTLNRHRRAVHFFSAKEILFWKEAQSIRPAC